MSPSYSWMYARRIEALKASGAAIDKKLGKKIKWSLFVYNLKLILFMSRGCVQARTCIYPIKSDVIVTGWESLAGLDWCWNTTICIVRHFFPASSTSGVDENSLCECVQKALSLFFVSVSETLPVCCFSVEEKNWQTNGVFCGFILLFAGWKMQFYSELKVCVQAEVASWLWRVVSHNALHQTVIQLGHTVVVCHLFSAESILALWK